MSECVNFFVSILNMIDVATPTGTYCLSFCCEDTVVLSFQVAALVVGNVVSFILPTQRIGGVV